MKKQYAINIDATVDEILKAQLWCERNGYELVFVMSTDKQGETCEN